jgi:hypothetical protein
MHRRINRSGEQIEHGIEATVAAVDDVGGGHDGLAEVGKVAVAVLAAHVATVADATDAALA